MKSNPPDNLRDIHEAPADIRAELARAAGPLGIFARRVHWLDTTTSTNDVAAHLAELGAAEGTTVAADAQTAGRGRLGRAWFSPPGAGLYVSIVLRPSGDLSTRSNPSAFLTLASGVAIAEGVRTGTGLPAEIKWPNDVMIGRRKLAGIVAEAAAQGNRLQHVIVGRPTHLQGNKLHPDSNGGLDAQAQATILNLYDPNRAQIFTQIPIAFSARYRDLQAGRFDAILSAWRALSPSLPSSWVEWDTAAGVMRGRAEDIDEHGALMVRVGNKMERLVAGEVRWVQ